MNAVIIGASGHVDYAFLGNRSLFSVVGIAPGHVQEDISKLRHQLPKVPVFEDYRSLLRSVRAEVAVVNPFYALTGPIAAACLHAGMSVLAEKPLAINAAVLKEIAELAETNGLKLGTMQVHRYEPWFCAAMHALHSGDIGKPLLITAQKSYKMGHKPMWMKSKALFGGLIPWVGAHALDWLVWALPGAWRVEWAHMTTEGNGGQGEVESVACLGLAAGNAFATVQLDYLRPESAPSHGEDRLRIVGEKGIIEVKDNQAFCHNDVGTAILELTEQPLMMDSFIRWVQGEGSFRSPIHEAATVANLCIKGESIAQQRPSLAK